MLIDEKTFLGSDGLGHPKTIEQLMKCVEMGYEIHLDALYYVLPDMCKRIKELEVNDD